MVLRLSWTTAAVVGDAEDGLGLPAEPGHPLVCVRSQLDAVLAHQGRAADQNPVPLQVCPHTHAEDDLAFGVQRNLDVLFLGVPDDGLGQWVAGVDLAGRGEGQDLVGGERVAERHDVGDQWPAEGERACLVEDDGGGPAGVL